jgi:hypothetical protein
MDVMLKPPFGGCLMVFVIVITLGTYPLLRRFGERHFIARMDDEGVETRGGKRVAWTDVTHVQRVVGKVQGVQMSDEYVVKSTRGRLSLPLWRTTNGAEALDYFVRRVPAGVWAQQ